MRSLLVCLNYSRLLLSLGGPGLIVVGIVDNSFIPFPGIQDFLTAVLSASDRDWWLYYAVMSTLGALLGGYLTFRVGRKGGEKALEGRLSAEKLETVYRRFREWGWGAIFIPVILPPPFPAVPFLFAAGALNYPLKKYLAVLAAGRFLRYLVIALLASVFGRRLLGALRDGSTWLLVSVVVIGVSAVVFVVWYLARKRVQAKAPSE